MICILWQLSLNHPQTIQIYFGRPEGLRISKGDFVPCGTDRHGHLHLVPHTDKGRALISNRQPSLCTFSCSPPSRSNRSRYPRNIRFLGCTAKFSEVHVVVHLPGLDFFFK